MRCFIAVELPPAIREKLTDLQERLQSLDRCIRWTRPEQIHLTLKFLGDVPDAIVPDVCSATLATAAMSSPIPVDVRGIGCFPPRGPARVLWAGIDGPPAGLVACHRALEKTLAHIGFAPEDRPFTPHLTIGRARDSRGAREARSVIEELADCRAGSFTARELVVFQSILGPAGSTYTILARAPFSAPISA